MRETVAVLGASNKPHRYAYQAMTALRDAGHRVLPVNPRLAAIDDLPCYPSLRDLPRPVDTVTVYVGPQRLRPLVDDLLALAPQRVILNPGTEDATVAARLRAAAITVDIACTLVLLRTGQY